MKPPQAQLFLSVVLLDAIREDIISNKKLNPQYYEALKRALYKPGAFFKGIIFPMLDVQFAQLSFERDPLTSYLAGLLPERGCYRSFNLGSDKNTCSACVCSTAPHSRNGLFR